ncbi:unnamed protein product [Linum tenue]|uniref:Uncharacterized protein n=1 Tax=Linum tenue TaxID=586396 RepID=A0AAV0IVK3_9ROSI|nr:unnamed protein product [Linum tenue]
MRRLHISPCFSITTASERIPKISSHAETSQFSLFSNTSLLLLLAPKARYEDSVKKAGVVNNCAAAAKNLHGGNFLIYPLMGSQQVDSSLVCKMMLSRLALPGLVNWWVGKLASPTEKEFVKITSNYVQHGGGVIVRDQLKPPPKLKLVAKKWELEIDEEEVGSDLNGTEIVIATKDSPELDAAALVIERVLQGMGL